MIGAALPANRQFVAPRSTSGGSFIFPDPVAARKRWRQVADELNAQQPIIEVIQRRKDGSERKMYRQKKAVSSSVLKSGRELIRLYVGHLHRTARMVGHVAFHGGLPGFLTNRPELADLFGCCERTAYDHVQALVRAGLVQKRFRGTHADFELWLTPSILWGGDRVDNSTDPRQPVASAPALVALNPDSSPPISQNLPLNNVTVTHGNHETETMKGSGEVENGDRNHGDARQSNHVHGDTERQQPTPAPPCHNVTVTEKGGGGAPGGGPPNDPSAVRRPALGLGTRMKERLAGKAPRPAPRRPGRTDAEVRAIREGYLQAFWGYARQSLYAGRRFTDHEQALILAEIRTGVYADFGVDLTEKEWDVYQTELYRRVDLAAGYYQRHPDKWVPDPYSKFRPGTGYFAAENLRGFRHTNTWLEANLRAYRTSYVNQRLSLAIRYLTRHRQGRAPKRLQQMTYLDAYRHLERQMARYGEGPLGRFHQAAATMQPTPTA